LIEGGSIDTFIIIELKMQRENTTVATSRVTLNQHKRETINAYCK
jgi:hypothetical protein